jgi:hypothetical protein
VKKIVKFAKYLNRYTLTPTVALGWSHASWVTFPEGCQRFLQRFKLFVHLGLSLAICSASQFRDESPKTTRGLLLCDRWVTVRFWDCLLRIYRLLLHEVFRCLPKSVFIEFFCLVELGVFVRDNIVDIVGEGIIPSSPSPKEVRKIPYRSVRISSVCN